MIAGVFIQARHAAPGMARSAGGRAGATRKRCVYTRCLTNSCQASSNRVGNGVYSQTAPPLSSRALAVRPPNNGSLCSIDYRPPRSPIAPVPCLQTARHLANDFEINHKTSQLSFVCACSCRCHHFAASIAVLAAKRAKS